MSDILEDLGVRYHLGGSFASAIHGVPRQTMDADLVVDLAAATVTQLVERLHDDSFVKGDGEYDEVELERSVVTRISNDPPRTARVKTAEDTVLRKLQWFRSGGEVSDRQWKDVLGVMATVGAGLDRGYLHTWATRLGVVDLLDRASAEVDGG